MDKSKVNAFIRVLHPQEWIKNLFVVIPLIYSENYLYLTSLLHVLYALVVFCLATSTVYIVNDIVDLEHDKRHPVKCHRPLASAQLRLRDVLFVIYLFYALLLLGIFIVPNVMLVIIAYIVLNYVYSFFVKRFPIIGAFFMAFGMVLRVWAGSLVIAVPLSPWVFFTTLSFGYMLGAVKYYLDRVYITDQQQIKPSAMHANWLLYLICFAAVATCVFYTVFVVFFNSRLAVTIPFLLAGIFRYVWLIQKHPSYDSVVSPIFSDIFIVLIILVWLGLTLFVKL